MSRPWPRLCALLLVAACEVEGSGQARKVANSPPPPPARPLPETAGPSCAEVAEQLAAGLSTSTTVRTEVDLANAMRKSIQLLCRQQQWSQGIKECAMGHRATTTVESINIVGRCRAEQGSEP